MAESITSVICPILKVEVDNSGPTTSTLSRLSFMKSTPLHMPHDNPQPTAQSVAERIRKLRLERGWSRSDVERLSKGSLKAVVLGSYERCDRTLSLNRVIDIAKIFSVPLAHLLAEPQKSAPTPTLTTMMVDLRRVRSLAGDPAKSREQALQTLSSFLVWIANRRCDWNGEVMSLRESDRTTLALMTMMNEEDLMTWLVQNKFLATGLSHP